MGLWTPWVGPGNFSRFTLWRGAGTALMKMGGMESVHERQAMWVLAQESWEGQCGMMHRTHTDPSSDLVLNLENLSLYWAGCPKAGCSAALPPSYNNNNSIPYFLVCVCERQIRKNTWNCVFWKLKHWYVFHFSGALHRASECGWGHKIRLFFWKTPGLFC